MICEWDKAFLLIFSNNGEPLIYYSHLTSIAIFLALFGITFMRLKPWPKVTFRMIAASYILWLFCDLVLWANDSIPNILFFWTIINLVEPLIFVFSFAYFYQFVEGRAISVRGRWIIFGLLLPTIIMAPIGLSVIGFDYTDCDRNAVEGIAAYYNYFLEAVFLILTAAKATAIMVSKRPQKEKTKLALMSVGTLFLLFSFLIANFLGTITGDYVTSQYGHLAVPIFAGFLAYITIRYESFEPRIVLVDTLVIALFVMLGSTLFVHKQEYQTYANLVAFGIMFPLAYLMVTSIRKEVKIRKQLQELTNNLELANNQQVTLIHFITHQLKGFVSKSRNIFAMISEGDYGPVPETMKPMIEEGFTSSTKGAQTIQEILNAANIKSGKVEYTMAPFDFSALITSIVANLKPNADAKGVEVTLSLPEAPVMFTGDQMQLENALKNLVDNTVKYTPSGSIALTLSEDVHHIRFITKDTGVGISAEDMQHLFTEGGHGAESVKVNVDSTGFGLYIVKNIVEGHGGTVHAESEGVGKGATFVVELPTGS